MSSAETAVARATRLTVFVRPRPYAIAFQRLNKDLHVLRSRMLAARRTFTIAYLGVIILERNNISLVGTLSFEALDGVGMAVSTCRDTL